MNRKELCTKTAQALREAKIKKSLRASKQTLHISDDYGNKKDFTVRHDETSVIYTADDVDRILSMCMEVIQDSLRRGESVSVSGFGSISLKYRQPRSTKIPGTEQWVEVKGQFVPKFSYGQRLKACARVYEASFRDRCNSTADLPYDESADPSVVHQGDV